MARCRFLFWHHPHVVHKKSVTGRYRASKSVYWAANHEQKRVFFGKFLPGIEKKGAIVTKVTVKTIVLFFTRKMGTFVL